MTFATTVRLENVHPLQGGILRSKHPSERRPGLPRESPWIFWPRFAWETLSKHAIFAGATVRLLLTAIAVSHAPGARNYMDQALTPVGDDGDETLDLFTKTTGGGAAVAHIKKDRQANCYPARLRTGQCRDHKQTSRNGRVMSAIPL